MADSLTHKENKKKCELLEEKLKGKDDANAVKKCVDLKNLTIVRVWSSHENQGAGEKSIGHISIETPNTYSSLWPTDHGKEVGNGLINPIQHEFKKDYNEDLKAEGGRLPKEFYFYYLETDKIDNQVRKSRLNVLGWSAIALPPLVDGESCASYAWKLLCVGGINKLMSKADQSVISSYIASKGISASNSHGSLITAEGIVSLIIKSPDVLYEYLELAKLREQQEHHETTELTGAIEPSSVKKPHSHGCCGQLLSYFNCITNNPKKTLYTLAATVAVVGITVGGYSYYNKNNY